MLVIGSANIISIAPPQPSSTNNVMVVQATNNSNGSVTDTDTLYSSANSGQAPVQYTDTLNANNSGSITANGQTINYAAGSQINTATDPFGNLIVSVVPSSSGSSANTFTITDNGITTNNTDGIPLTNVTVQSNGSYTNSVNVFCFWLSSEKLLASTPSRGVF